MPLYRCRRIDQGQVTGQAEIEMQDDDQAWREAHDGLDVLAGQWAEVTHVRPPREPVPEPEPGR